MLIDVRHLCVVLLRTVVIVVGMFLQDLILLNSKTHQSDDRHFNACSHMNIFITRALCVSVGFYLAFLRADSRL
jgi:hypothetical protein